jgi:hypothetical protein
LIERDEQIGALAFSMQILRRLSPRSIAPKHRLCRVDKLTGARNEAHAAHAIFEPHLIAARRPNDLERKLRDGVAIGLERQIFEHDIAKPR